MGLPAGTVTFLFTDIEASTRGIARVGDVRWAERLEAHRRLLREAFAHHAGFEVATEGDAFFVAFERAADAVVAASSGLRALGGHDWPDGIPLRVRAGVHTGEAIVVEDDYVGHDVHRAKRICDAGHGGQILLSEATAALVRQDLPEGLRLVDLGLHRLKDLGEAEHIFQLDAEGLVVDFPPLRSLESFTHTLPAQRTSFEGREQDIGAVRKLLEAHRLVSLTGIGGAGKTRLAIQVAAELLDAYPDGVYFVDLAPLSDGSLIARAVAEGLGIPMGADVDGTRVASGDELVIGYLSSRRALVVLDNCEHLLDDAAAVVERILDSCAGVSVLATSRENLDVEGEQSWRVPSLSVPGADDVTGSEAAQLFVARARAVRSDFEIGPANAAAVAEICRRLDGIPLAIEFAASRVSHLQPHEIAQRLDDMFRLLTGGRRRVQRQQTLQAVLDWSHDLLSEPERALLRRLAAFVGDFTLVAAEGICATPPVAADHVLDLLGSLVAKSLVTTLDAPDATRYRLMETVRAYASEKLREAGEADRLRCAHRDWFEGWAGSFPLEDVMLPLRENRRFGPDHANFRAALEWSETEDKPERVVRLATRLMHVWRYMGHVEEGYRWLTIARPEDLDLTPEERTAALANCHSLAIMHAELGINFADRAIQASHGRSSVPLAIALARRAVARAAVSLASGRPELVEGARADIDLALEHAGTKPEARALVMINGAFVELILGDIETASVALQGVLELHSDHLRAYSVSAAALHLLGREEEALAAAERYLELSSAETTWRADASHEASCVAVALAGAGQTDRGRIILDAALSDSATHFERRAVEHLLIGYAVVACLAGDIPRCSRLLSWVHSRVFEVGGFVESVSWALYRHYTRLARQNMDKDEAGRCQAEGRVMTRPEAVAHAQALGR